VPFAISSSSISSSSPSSYSPSDCGSGVCGAVLRCRSSEAIADGCERKQVSVRRKGRKVRSCRAPDGLLQCEAKRPKA